MKASWLSLLAISFGLFFQLDVDAKAGPKPPQLTPAQAAERQRRFKILSPHLVALQGQDQAKREAAIKFMSEMGTNEAYIAAKSLEKSNRPEVKKAAQTIRKSIETQSRALLQQAQQLESKMRKFPLTEEAILKVIKSFEAAEKYTYMQNLTRIFRHRISSYQNLLNNTRKARGNLTQINAQLGEKIEPLTRAKLLQQRAAQLTAVRDMVKARQDLKEALSLTKGQDRMQPALLLALAKVQKSFRDYEGIVEICDKIIKTYPKSFESIEAHRMKADALEMDEQLDAFVEALLVFGKTYPHDKKVQEFLEQAMQVLQEDYLDYQRTAKVALFLLDNLPDSRLNLEIPKNVGLIAEYILKDYTLAERAYAKIKTLYPDAEDLVLLDKSIARVKAKAKKTFPKNPATTDAEPLGTLAKFLAAAAKRDFEGLAKLSPSDMDADDWDFDLEDYIFEMVFCDFEITKVVKSEDSKKAFIYFKHHLPESEDPEERHLIALIEENTWRIEWPENWDAVEEPDKPATGDFVTPTEDGK